MIDTNTYPKRHIYVKHVIGSTLQIHQMKYRQTNLLSTLQQQHAFLQFNTYSTHREAYIGWFKYISTSITLQSSAKLRVKTLLKTSHLTSSEIAPLINAN